MRFSHGKHIERGLARGAAVILIGGLAAGCSSSALRFGGSADDFYTASTPNQKQIIKPVDQPFPGDQVAAAPVDGTYTGSVSRNAVKPVDLGGKVARSELAPVGGATTTALAPVAAKPLASASNPLASGIDNTTTGTVAPVVEQEVAGWSRAGGTQITVKDGETVYNLSRRFGVPANVITKVNGLAEGGGLKAGQKVIIPTYVYSSAAPVSAPDANPDVAAAKSSRGTKYDVPSDKVPVPTRPADNVAVLPQAPKVKEGEAAPATEAAAATTAAPSAGAGGVYKVAEGDTLSRIAKKTGVSATRIREANGLKDGLIRVGQKLTIPAGGKAGAQVASAPAAAVDPIVTGTSGPAKKAKAEEVAAYTPPRKAGKAIAEAEAESVDAAPDSTGIGRMRWPVRGRVVSAYGSGGGKANDGIDIAVPEGTPVKAAENGVVIYAGDGLKEFGNTVLVRHENGLVTVYGHASELKVSRGEKVKRGQEIAKSGMSGTTDAPKLHFEVRKNSAPVDPSTFLE